MKLRCYLAIIALQVPLMGYVRSENLEVGISGFNTVALSSGVLKKEFQEIDRRKTDLAKSILISQLEPDKPQYLDRDDQRCIPKEEILAKRLPYIEKEVKRLLQPENAKYFELVSIGDISPVMFSFSEWGSSLKDPKDRIEFWKRVLSLLPEKPKDLRSEPLRQLVYAHTSYGGQLMLKDRQAAKDEIELAESLSKNLSMDNEFSGILKNLKHWIERKPKAAAIKASDLIGKYTTGPSTDFFTLILKEGNVYEFEARSDFIDLCTGGRWLKKQGEYSIEGRYLLLKPGPNLAVYGIESPEYLVPIIWGKNVFLHVDSAFSDGIPEFCNVVNTGSPAWLKILWDWNFHKTQEDESQTSEELPGKPLLPEEWQDCILNKPLYPEVLNVGEKSIVVLNMGHDAGLRVGMKLYLKNPKIDERAIWKISEVQSNESRAVPFYENASVIKIGEKLSTRIPD
jgi:hypothetical protein